jgi:hypothetical protein
LLDPGKVEVQLDGTAIGTGRRSFELDRGDVELPAGFTLVELRPSRVRLSVRTAPLGPDGSPLSPELPKPAAGNGAGATAPHG